jgi:hypothetical protein
LLSKANKNSAPQNGCTVPEYTESVGAPRFERGTS